MAERKIKGGKLELSLVSITRVDVLARENKVLKNEKKVGEVDTYKYCKEGVEGIISYKEVYDLNGNQKSSYFSDTFITFVEELLKVESDLGVSKEYIRFGDERTLKCQ